MPIKLRINGKLLLLLGVLIPLTLWSKLKVSNSNDYNEAAFQNQLRHFLVTQGAVISQDTPAFNTFIPIAFKYKNCDSAVVVLPPSDSWSQIIKRRTPTGHIAKFIFKDYFGDEQPNYRATFAEFSAMLLHPLSNKNPRQTLLALIATPQCMTTLQTMVWNTYWE
ncbi:MAG TPA: hypothetical protein PKC80_02225 [Burkholderiaceae bacterium]|nr:hypothetical protein [Burkholderiaceae bacterium]